MAKSEDLNLKSEIKKFKLKIHDLESRLNKLELNIGGSNENPPTLYLIFNERTEDFVEIQELLKICLNPELAIALAEEIDEAQWKMGGSGMIRVKQYELNKDIGIYEFIKDLKEIDRSAKQKL